MKITKYLFLELLFILLVINNYGFVYLDSGEAICDTTGITNYLEFGWNNYFHWFRNDMDQVCRFDAKSLFMNFWFILTYYTLFKVLTVYPFPAGCRLRFLIPEMAVYILSFGSRIITQDQFIITYGSLANAALGLIYMFLPLISCMFFVYALCYLLMRINKPSKLLYGGMVFISSLLIFPPFITIFYCLLLFPSICWLIYVDWAKVFINMVSQGKAAQHKYFIFKLALSIILWLCVMAGEVFFFRTFYQELSGFGVLTYYILFSAVIHAIYYGLMVLIWAPLTLHIIHRAIIKLKQ